LQYLKENAMFHRWLRFTRRHRLIGFESRQNARRGRHTRPKIEALEARYAPSCTIGIVNRVLTVQCDDTSFNYVTVDHGSDFFGPHAIINSAVIYDSYYDSIRINGGRGGLSTVIAANVKPLSLFGQAQDDRVYVGNSSRTLSGIQASLDLENPPAHNDVQIDDRGDASAAHTGTINVVAIGGSLFEQVAGFGAGASINAKVADTSVLAVDAGSGGAAVNVLSTAVFSTVVEAYGPSLVTVGNQGSVQGIQGFLNVGPVNGGSPRLVVDDSADAGNRTVQMVREADNAYRIMGLAPATLLCGANTDAVFRTGRGVEQVLVAFTPPGTGSRTTFEGHSPNTTVTIGSNGSLANIQSPVTITNPPSYTILNIDDSADSATHNNVVVTAGSATGLAPAVINYTQSDLAALNIHTGTGANSINVQSTPTNFSRFPRTTLIGNSDSTIVNVGNAGSVQGIQGRLYVDNLFHETTLNVDDSADRTGRNVALSVDYGQGIGTISGLAPAAITYGASLDISVRAVTVLAGSGGNVFTVNGTGLNGQTTTITTGRGSGVNDHVFVAATSASGPVTVNLQNDSTTAPAGVTLGGNNRTLDNILAPVTVNTLSGGSDLGLVDDQTVAGQTYTVTANTVTRSGRLLATYQITNELSLYASHGTNIINVLSTSQATVINAGWSNDTITLGDSANTLSHLIGGGGFYLALQINNPGSQIVFNDQGSTDSRTYGLVTDARIPAPALFVSGVPNEFVFFGPLQSLVVNGSGGSDVFNLDTTFAATTINGGPGGNCFHVTPTDQYLADIAAPLTLNGGGNDILDFFDANNPNSETYTFDSVPSSLSLATVPVTVNFSGMGAIYLMTNGMSTLDDPSGSIIVDPAGGPPCGPSGSGVIPSYEDTGRMPTHEAVILIGGRFISDGLFDEVVSREDAGDSHSRVGGGPALIDSDGNDRTWEFDPNSAIVPIVP
jgi:hypothetical protein